MNYGGNRKPELITVNHEGIGATIAHGYFKAAGKPMAVLVHGAVGTQHLPMAVYSAWCDRVPMIVLIGNHNEPSERGGPTDWYHSAQDVPSILRAISPSGTTPSTRCSSSPNRWRAPTRSH